MIFQTKTSLYLSEKVIFLFPQKNLKRFISEVPWIQCRYFLCWDRDFNKLLKVVTKNISLHVIIMPRKRLKMNLLSIATWMTTNPLLKTGARYDLSDINGIRTHNHLVYKWTLNHLSKLANIKNIPSQTGQHKKHS